MGGWVDEQRLRDRRIDRETDGWTERDRETGEWTERDRETGEWTERDRETEGRTERQTDSQTGRQIFTLDVPDMQIAQFFST
jgi:hypothetical protein